MDNYVKYAFWGTNVRRAEIRSQFVFGLDEKEAIFFKQGFIFVWYHMKE